MSQDSKRIRHSVIFKLKYEPGSAEEKAFAIAAKKLVSLPGVEKFEYLKQISNQNNFEYGISMEFADAKTYHGYNTHPEHLAFVENTWKNNVEDFLEIDFLLGE